MRRLSDKKRKVPCNSAWEHSKEMKTHIFMPVSILKSLNYTFHHPISGLGISKIRWNKNRGRRFWTLVGSLSLRIENEKDFAYFKENEDECHQKRSWRNNQLKVQLKSIILLEINFSLFSKRFIFSEVIMLKITTSLTKWFHSCPIIFFF